MVHGHKVMSNTSASARPTLQLRTAENTAAKAESPAPGARRHASHLQSPEHPCGILSQSILRKWRELPRIWRSACCTPSAAGSCIRWLLRKEGHEQPTTAAHSIGVLGWWHACTPCTDRPGWMCRLYAPIPRSPHINPSTGPGGIKIGKECAQH